MYTPFQIVKYDTELRYTVKCLLQYKYQVTDR